MIDEPRLIRALDRIVAGLRKLQRPVVNLLQPGLTDAAIDQLTGKLPFALTEELRALYRWRNGTLAKEGDRIDDLWFFPGFYFPSLDEAVEYFDGKANAPQWEEEWFPFIADGAGDFYVVPCEPEVRDTAPVIGFVHGEPEQEIEYLSITTMMESLADGFSQGAFAIDAAGLFEMDDDRFELIARQHNPGVPAWLS